MTDIESRLKAAVKGVDERVAAEVSTPEEMVEAVMCMHAQLLSLILLRQKLFVEAAPALREISPEFVNGLKNDLIGLWEMQKEDSAKVN